MKGKGMEKRTQKRNRCSRWQIYSYVIHVVLDNSKFQGKRKGFRLKNTNPEEYSISFSEAYRILKDLSEAGVFTRLENHRRSWRMSEWFRGRLSHLEFEQRKVLAQRLHDVVQKEIVYRIKANPAVKEQILDAVGFSKSEMQHFQLIEEG
jgi:hypothetical protein